MTKTIDYELYDALKASWVERGKFIKLLLNDSAGDQGKMLDRFSALVAMDDVFIKNIEEHNQK